MQVSWLQRYTSKTGIIVAPTKSLICFSHHQLPLYILLYTQSSLLLYIQDDWYVRFSPKHGCPMKILRQSIKFWDCMVRFCPAIFSASFSNSNSCSVYLLLGIFYSTLASFFIYLSMLQYKSFLGIGFINRLVRNLPILYLIVSDSAK